MLHNATTAELSPDWTDRFRSGDREVFHRVHQECGPVLLAFLRARCRGSLDASDVSQAVWLSAWGRREQFVGGNFRAWLFQIARNELCDEYRRRGRSREAAAVPDDLDFVESIAEEPDQRLEAMHSCIEAVGGDFVQVLRLRLLGLSVEAISERMGVASSTVYTRADRGKKALRECIERKLT